MKPLKFKIIGTDQIVTLSQKKKPFEGEGYNIYYDVEKNDDWSAKICEHLFEPLKLKLTQMQKQKPAKLNNNNGVKIAWPLGLLAEIDDPTDGIKGYLMQKLENEMQPINEFYTQQLRKRHDFPSLYCKTILELSRNLANAFQMVHEWKQNNTLSAVIGHITESDILASEDSHVLLSSPEHFQFKFSKNGSTIPSYNRNGDMKFTHKEILEKIEELKKQKKQGKPTAPVNFDLKHDNFSLAVLIFLLLMEGKYPYAPPNKGKKQGFVDLIKRGTFPPNFRPDGPPFDKFPNELQEQFTKSFLKGRVNPDKIPDAWSWSEILKKQLKDRCNDNCFLKDASFILGEKVIDCCLCHLEVKILLTLWCLSPLSTSELGILLGKKTYKTYSACTALQKQGWIISRKMRGGTSMNLFPMTGEIVEPQNRKRIYKTIFYLIEMIEKYPNTRNKINGFFNRRIKSMYYTGDQKTRMKVFKTGFIKALEQDRKNDAYWMSTLIPFSLKVRFWSINPNLSNGEFERFIRNNLTKRDKASLNITPGNEPFLNSFMSSKEIEKLLE